ncbi:Ger(x)C family spore germination protein [Paenibacillus sp. GCM10012303]|uniref:Ger(x)C family spore germination protein n=1 Tax=Paenibacillus sp. GCM10012303 TaxID=3317340 RepID=UPI00362406A9
MRVFRSFIIVVLFSVTLSGCWGMREIEHMNYLNSVGIDYRDGKIVFYGQIISYFNVAKKEGGDPGQKQIISTMKAEGDTFDKAVFNMYTTTQQRVAWSHVKALVFTEQALKKNIIEQVFDVWDRYYENRYTIWIFATKEPIEKVLEAKPAQNISVVYSQLNDPTNVYSQSSVVTPIYLYDFMRTWYEKSQSLKIPYLTIDENWKENGKMLPKLQINGIGVFQNGKYKGYIPRIRLHGLRWLTKKTDRTPLYVKENGKSADESTLVMENVKPKIKAEVQNGKAEFKIEVRTKGNIPQLLQPLSQQKLEKLAAAKIKAEIEQTYMEGLRLDSDLLGLSEALFRSKPKQWHELARNGKLPLEPDSLVSIEVKASILSGGISKIKQE